jgi:hypothetical protein
MKHNLWRCHLRKQGEKGGKEKEESKLEIQTEELSLIRKPWRCGKGFMIWKVMWLKIIYKKIQ